MSKVTPLIDKIEKEEQNLPPRLRGERFLRRSKFVNDWLNSENDGDDEPEDLAWGKANIDGGFVPDDEEE
ncbi:hypothetical protein EUZ85_15930 [Hahella sp. KA22]|uniref:hypothetical protein n=1 Tax=Hahella sp. KA22 TaxID=1628392 RepID=UPI000FDEEC29|nr:hypothetical protein [Hahella sp. KA22]AZZ92133.1 hypothetical protein ENC22_13365 [Hahella sp. KA22]QAY55504.1 hypothetical protein EUZ85_15930 [Hahella sp. KA22]